MLIDFSVTNFRSIKEKQVFSLVVMNKIKELPENVLDVNENVHLLSGAIIYGANGSGKSNIIKGLQALQDIAVKSDKNKVDKEIPQYQPFRLDKTTQIGPIEFEINFIGSDKLVYRYFVLFNRYEIIEESLSYYPGKNPANLFYRKKGRDISVGSIIDKMDAAQVEKKLYPNQSFLSKIGNERIEGLIVPFSFFYENLILYNKFDEDDWVRLFTEFVQSKNHARMKADVSELIKAADIGIKDLDFKVEEDDDFKFPEGFSESVRQAFIDRNKYKVKTLHTIYNGDDEPVAEVEFDLIDESAGTNKLVSASICITAALVTGGVLIIDELDKSLHPNLTKFLIGLFNSKNTNPNNAQLIFATHDVSLLTNKLFRRDQIYFTEKNFKGSSEYYSLGQIPGVRKELSYEKYYMKGVFGGVPRINEFDVQLKFPEVEKTNS